MVDRVQLHHEFGTRPLKRWCTESAYGPFSEHVTFGRLADGRWFCHVTRQPQGAWVYPATDDGERQALEHCERWMAESEQRFVPTPAVYDGFGQPADGRQWVKQGSNWVLPEGVEGD